MLFGKKKKNKVFNEEKIVVGKDGSVAGGEGYDRLKDNILYLNADGTNKVIQIESSVAHEGKTTIACCTGVSLGATDKKVIVVDLDFRKPRIQQKFGISIDTGISDYLLGTATKEEIIKPTEFKNVSAITRGGKVYNSSLILVSDKFRKLIAELRKEYDYVILDCAPVLQVSDYIHISQVSDGVIFLVAYGSTTRNQVADAVKELRKAGAKILGTVFSMYDKKRDKGYGYYYGKGYYNKSYYGYYKSYLDDEEKSEDDKAAGDAAAETTAEDKK